MAAVTYPAIYIFALQHSANPTGALNSRLALTTQLSMLAGGEKEQLQSVAWDNAYVNGTVAAAGVAFNATAAASSMHLMLTRLPNCFTVGVYYHFTNMFFIV